MGNEKDNKLVRRMNQIKVLNAKEMGKALSQEELEIKLAQERIEKAEENLKNKLATKEELSHNLVQSKRKVLQGYDQLKTQEVVLNEAIVDAERKSLDEIQAELKLTEIQEKRLEIEFDKSIDLAAQERAKAIEHRENSKNHEEELLDIQLAKHQEELDAIIKSSDKDIQETDEDALEQQQRLLKETEIKMLEEEALASEVEGKMDANDALSAGSVEERNAVLNKSLGLGLSRKERKALKKGLKDGNK